MPSKKDYIPKNHALFQAWFNNFTMYVSIKTTGSKPDWDHILKREMDALFAAYDDWFLNYTPTLKPHSPDLTAMRDEARARAEKVIRAFVKRHMYVEPVTSGDRINLGLPNHDLIRTDHTIVNEETEWHFEVRGIRQLHAHFKVFGASGKAKPTEYICVVAYEVRDASEPPPERPEDLTRRINASRTPVTITFDETERGKKVYMAMAWQNDRKVLGKWSAIQWTYVP